MDNLIFSVNAVLPLFLVMAVGYFFRRKGIFTDEFLNAANRFCFTAALPALLFMNAYSSAPAQVFNLKLLTLTVAIILGVVALSCLFVPLVVKDLKKASAMIQGIYRSNAALFAMPLTLNIFGQQGLPTMTLLLALAVPLYNVLAVIVLSVFSSENREGSLKKIRNQLLSNWLIWGTFLGLACSALGVKLPVAAQSAISSISAIATPLAMLCIGANFEFKSAAQNLKYTLPTSLLRLMVVPFAATALGAAVGFRGVELGCMYIIFSAPIASSSYIMAQSMGSDGKLAGELIVMTTMLSLFTVFLGVFTLKSLTLI